MPAPGCGMPSADNFPFFFDSSARRLGTEGGEEVEGDPMPVDPKRVQIVFLAAAEQEGAAGRAAILDRLCGADAELRQRVETLLRAHEAPGRFLESLAPNLV